MLERFWAWLLGKHEEHPAPPVPVRQWVEFPADSDEPAILRFPRSAIYGQQFDLHAEDDNAPMFAAETWPRLRDPERVARAVEAMRDDGLTDGAGI
jgi:hypothetical protein